MRGRFDKKFPCKNATCDNNGTVETIIGDYERDLEQCQYCDIERFPILAFIESELALREAHHKALRAKELREIRERIDGIVYAEKRLSPLTEGITATEAILEQQEQNRKDHYFKKGWQEARHIALAYIDELIEKPQ